MKSAQIGSCRKNGISVFLHLKAEFFACDAVQLWNMAVVEEILKKLPSQDRLL
jgi:hypothetical protein